jgi:uncharacterized protein (DUF1800 family)
MELFALGIGAPGSPNYTEDDIKQATRAFTGYSLDASGNFVLNAGQHDGSTKTVLGQQCESGDQVHAILVRYQKNGRNVCAHFMAAKLFSFFAYPVTPYSAVVSGFAQTFVSSNLSIRALVEAILKSPQFSSNAAYRALVKSPVELGVGMLRALGGERIPNNLRSRMRDAGQRLFYPPDVSGWPSGQAWINASTLLQRCNMGALVVNSLGKTATSEAGGPSVRTHIEALPTGTAKVDRVALLLVDGDLPAASRAALVTYANTATTDEKMRGLFNLMMAQPAYQLN